MNKDEVLKAIDVVKCFLKEDYIEIEDMYSGECRGGTIDVIKECIVSLDEICENKCEFKLIIGAKEKDFMSRMF